MIINNLCKKYKTGDGEVTALNNITLELPDTGLVIITGRSGCGKTTLLHSISGLVSVDSGSIEYNGQNLCSLSEREWDGFRNKNIGLIFQNYELLENWTVEENISIPIEIQTISDKKDRITKSLEVTGIAELRKRKVNELSGGQKQRVAIARAVIKEQGFILADEPTGNLDSENGEQIWRLLKDISKARLVIAVTHDKEMAERFSDRLIEMSDGLVISNIVKCAEETKTKRQVISDNDQICRLPLKTKFSTAGKILGRKIPKLVAAYVTLTVVLVLILSLVTVLDFKYGKALKRYTTEHNLPYLEVGVWKNYTDPLLNENYKTITNGNILHEALESGLGKENIISIDKDVALDTGDETTSLYVGVLCFENIWGLRFKGRIPEKDNEILITDYLMWKLGLNEESVYLSDSVHIRLDGNEYDVCGIIMTDYEALGIKNTPQDYLTPMQQNSIDCYYQVVAVMAESYRRNSVKPDKIRLRYGDLSRHDRFLGYMNREVTVASAELISASRLLAGRMPKAEDEILIDEQMMYELGLDTESFNDSESLVYEFPDLGKAEYDGFFNDSINLYDFYPKGVKIVGVAETRITEFNADYYIEKNKWASFYKVWDDNYHYDAYAVNCDIDFAKVIDDNELRGQISASEGMLIIRDNIAFIKPFIKAGIIALSVLGFALLLNVISFSIKDSSEMVGIFRALGMSKRDTLGIFITESFIILLPSCLIGLVTGIFALGWANDYLNRGRLEAKYTTFVMNPLLTAGTVAIFLLMGLALATIRIIRMSNTKPAELLNDKQ